MACCFEKSVGFANLGGGEAIVVAEEDVECGSLRADCRSGSQSRETHLELCGETDGKRRKDEERYLHILFKHWVKLVDVFACRAQAFKVRTCIQIAAQLTDLVVLAGSDQILSLHWSDVQSPDRQL